MPSPRLYESSIYVSLKKLRGKLYDMQYRMPKSARAIYAAPMLRLSAETIKHFIIAYTVPKRREDEVLEALGYFGALRCDIEHLFQHDIVDILDRRWFEYVAFNRDRVCLQPKPRFKKLNLILQKYDRTRKGRTTAAAKRATARTAGRNAPV